MCIVKIITVNGRKQCTHLVCGLNFQVGFHDRLRVNSDADEALA